MKSMIAFSFALLSVSVLAQEVPSAPIPQPVIENMIKMKKKVVKTKVRVAPTMVACGDSCPYVIELLVRSSMSYNGRDHHTWNKALQKVVVGTKKTANAAAKELIANDVRVMPTIITEEDPCVSVGEYSLQIQVKNPIVGGGPGVDFVWTDEGTPAVTTPEGQMGYACGE